MFLPAENPEADDFTVVREPGTQEAGKEGEARLLL